MAEAQVEVGTKPKVKAKTDEPKVKVLSLTPPQRDFLITNFKDEFETVVSSPGQRLFRMLGPSLQSVLRDSIVFHFKYSPISVEVRTEQVTENTVRDFYKFELKLEVPGVKHEFTLTREIAREVLERQ